MARPSAALVVLVCGALAMICGAAAVSCAPRSDPQPEPGPVTPYGMPSGGTEQCAAACVGPLLPIAHDPRPAPATTGGVIHDGIYDLTQIVVFGSSKQTTRPGMRGSWTIRTEERSSNHVGGTIWQTIEESPDVACRIRRFAVTQLGLRISGQGDDEFVRFTASPDSLTLISDETSVGLFFRRRR